MLAVVDRTTDFPGSGCGAEVVAPPLMSRPHPVVAPAVRLRRQSPSTYRRRRALAAGTVAALIGLATLVLGWLGGGSLTAPERPLPGVEAVYVVQPGDTLWSIARKLSPSDADPRPLVDTLVAEHGGATLVVGEPIRLPLRT